MTILSTVGRRGAITVAAIHGLIATLVALLEPEAGSGIDEMEVWFEFRELFPDVAGLLDQNQRIAGAACAALAVAVMIAYVGNPVPGVREWSVGWMLAVPLMVIPITETDTEEIVFWSVLFVVYFISQALMGPDVLARRSQRNTGQP